MPRVDEGKVHMTSIPERVCKIQLPSTGQLQKTRYKINHAIHFNLNYTIIIQILSIKLRLLIHQSSNLQACLISLTSKNDAWFRPDVEKSDYPEFGEYLGPMH